MTHQITILSAVLSTFLLLPIATPEAEAGVSISIGGPHFGLSIWDDDYYNYGHGGGVDFSVALDGWGEWVYVSGLGRVWQPWVANDWRPFSHGRWTYTHYGWTWVSYEPWGWVGHHYGNWAFSHHGWVWVPGNTWSPATVDWYSSNGYVGWYPRSPNGWGNAHWVRRYGYRHGYDRGYSHGYGHGYNDGYEDAMLTNWVRWGDMQSDRVHDRIDRAHHRSRDHASRVAAPKPFEVERRGGGRVATLNVQERTVGEGRSAVRLVRPEGLSESVQRHSRESSPQALGGQALQRFESRASGPSDRRPSVTSSSPRGELSSSKPQEVVRQPRFPDRLEVKPGSPAHRAPRPELRPRGETRQPTTPPARTEPQPRTQRPSTLQPRTVQPRTDRRPAYRSPRNEPRTTTARPSVQPRTVQPRTARRPVNRSPRSEPRTMTVRPSTQPRSARPRAQAPSRVEPKPARLQPAKPDRSSSLRPEPVKPKSKKD